ncbi:hypothetical protein LAB1_01260 [Roseibium sp. LAB1]
MRKLEVARPEEKANQSTAEMAKAPRRPGRNATAPAIKTITVNKIQDGSSGNQT